MQREKKQPPPPEPTPEEIAAQEAAAKAAAANKKSALSNKKGQEPAAVVEEKKPEPVVEFEDPDFLDGLWEDHEVDGLHGLLSTVTLKNGLLIQLLPTGDVLQTSDRQVRGESRKVEQDRVITGRGAVIRHLVNKDIEILYPNGNRSYFERDAKMWTFTNNKGMRRARKDGVEWDLEPVHAS